MIFVGILFVLGLIYFFGDHKKFSNILRQGDSAEDILKMRYVKGEINEETFEKMKKTIF